MSRPRGNPAYENVILGLIARYGGAHWSLQDSPVTTGPDAGVCRELTGRFNGAVSGVTWYNQVTLSGTLNPDATGTYTVAGTTAYGIYYKRTSPSDYYLFLNSAKYWIANYRLLDAPEPRYSGWCGAVVLPPQGIPLGATGGASGTATVTAVPASGTYLFVPSGVTLGSPGAPICGETVRAAALNGANPGGSITCGPASNFAYSTATISAWAKTTATDVNRIVVAKNNAFALYQALNVLAIYDYGGGAQRSTAVTCADGKWNHVALVYVSGAANGTKIYLNGTLVLTTTMTVSNQNSSLMIGASGTANQYWLGSLAHVTVLAGAASASEVGLLYQASKGMIQ